MQLLRLLVCCLVQLFDMDNYYYTKCLHPRKVLNRYTQQSIIVPCGKCIVCENAKSSVNSIRCHAESQTHRYMFFVTLTYAPEYLPTASLVPIIEHYDEPDKYGYNYRHSLKHGYYLVNDIDGDIIGEYYPKKYIDMLSVVRKCNISCESDVYRRVPVLYKPHVQLFMKRLRKYLSKYSDEKIRYFCCGEYGPKYYRPHYHLLLWFENEETAAYLHDGIRSCWKFGRTDCSQSFGGASSYVARYVNGNCNLPLVFRMAQSKPFSTHSQHLGDSIFATTTENFEVNDPNTALSCCVPYGQQYKQFAMWRSVKNSVFPKCQGFYEKSEQQRSYAYQIYDVARRWTEEDKTINIARKVVDYLLSIGIHHEVPVIDKLLKYFYDSVAFPFDEHTPFRYEQLLGNVYRQLLTSRYFLYNICGGDYNRIPFFIRQIQSYYDMVDRQNLSEQMKIREEDDEFDDNFYFPSLWNEDTIFSIQSDKKFQTYKQQITEIVSNGVKHKYQNDANLIFNYK